MRWFEMHFLTELCFISSEISNHGGVSYQKYISLLSFPPTLPFMPFHKGNVGRQKSKSSGTYFSTLIPSEPLHMNFSLVFKNINGTRLIT